MQIKSLLVIFFASGMLNGCSDRPDQTDIVINNVTIVDAVSPIRTARSVVVRGDKILARQLRRRHCYSRSHKTGAGGTRPSGCK